MKILHLVITRVALKYGDEDFYLSKFNKSSQDRLSEAVEIFDKYARKSLKNQIFQDFKLLSFFDNSVENIGSKLNNEVIIKFESLTKKPYINLINNYIKSLNQNFDYIILTRLDSDDLIRYDYLKIINEKIITNPIIEKYLDLQYIKHYDTKDFYSGYKKRLTSPFTSTIEKWTNNGIVGVIMSNHSKICEKLPGEKLAELQGIMTIHGDNNATTNIRGTKLNNKILIEYGL